jgi:hypothetical protein
MKIIISLITVWIFIFIVGCQSNTVDTETPLEDLASPVAPPTQGDITQMPTSLPTPADTGIQNLIEKAKEDLAQRLAVSANEINLVEATSVTWPDSSLGCPQKGMVYTQVLTSGYLILLEANGNMYEYHANRNTYVIFCENPSPPVPGTPADI